MRPRLRENHILKLILVTEETERNIFIMLLEFLKSQHAYVNVRVIQTAFTYLLIAF